MRSSDRPAGQLHASYGNRNPRKSQTDDNDEDVLEHPLERRDRTDIDF